MRLKGEETEALKTDILDLKVRILPQLFVLHSPCATHGVLLIKRQIMLIWPVVKWILWGIFSKKHSFMNAKHVSFGISEDWNTYKLPPAHSDAQSLLYGLEKGRTAKTYQDNTKIITLNCCIPTNITNLPTIWLDYNWLSQTWGGQSASPTSPNILRLGGIQQQKTQQKKWLTNCSKHLLKHAGSPVLCDAPALHLSNLSPGKIWDFYIWL